MKIFELDEYIKTWWSNIDVFYKKIFWIFFICMNVVFLYNSVFCLFGNEDIIVMFGEQSPCFNYFIARYGETILEYFLANKTIIPMFINILLFLFLSIAAVFLLNWFELKKTMFNYILAGLFILLTPTIYPLLWYRSVCFGMLLTVFFLIASFLLCQKINNENNNLKKVLYFSFALFFMVVFVFGCYQPIIGMVFGLLLAKIFIDCIDSNFSNIKNIVSKYKYIYIVIFSSLAIDYLIYIIFNLNGWIDNVNYPNVQMIDLPHIYTYIIPFLTRTLTSFFVDTFPYVGIFYKSILWLIVLVSIISVFTYQKEGKCNFKKGVVRLFLILFSFLVLFYVFNMMYFFASIFYNNPRLFRCEFWTTTSFVFVCVVFALKYSNVYLKNIIFCLMVVVIFLGIQINMHVQKDQMIGQQIELSRVMTLKDLICKNDSYEITRYMKYLYVQIGDMKSSGVIETYNSNKYNNAYVPEMISTFQTDRSFHLPLVVVPPKITNVNPYSSVDICIFSQLEKYLDSDLENWLLNKAKPYPSDDCVFIDKGKIFVVMDSIFLKEIKEKIISKQRV